MTRHEATVRPGMRQTRAMPSRRDRSDTPRPAGAASSDAVERFAAALKESEALDRERRRKEGAERAARAQAAASAAAQEQELRDARRRLERAIEKVRDAKRRGASTVEADREWKDAKARVIELETGAAPSWAPTPPPEEAHPDMTNTVGVGDDSGATDDPDE